MTPLKNFKIALVLLLSGSAASTPSAYAIGPEAAFELLKNVPEDFVNSGTVCEYVARLELKADYPEGRYEIEIGVSYLSQNQVIGELDVLIREKGTGRVPVVGEVKCWRDLRAGLRKATEQEARFRETIELGRQHPESAVSFTQFFGSKERPMFLEQRAFTPSFDYISLGQKGARAVGYDRELEMTLEELMELRKRLMGR
jgi:hypothetical protein